MTLIISLLSSNRITILADRRISSAGQTVDDQYNKLCVFCCYDARVVFAFTGIATFEGFDTSSWLLQELRCLGGADAPKIFDVLEAIRRKIGATLKSIGMSHKLLTIVIGGFWYEDDGVSHPLSCIITNDADDGTINSNFSVVFNDTSVKYALFLAGAKAAVPQPLADQLKDLAKRSLPRASLIRKAVGTMQSAAGAPSSHGTIGDYSSSATIDRRVNTPILCTYHAPTGANFAFGPNAVLPGLCLEGPELMSMTLLSGPSLHKNKRCWCGSGKKFKQCHHKKFGSVYVNLPGFTAPMSWVVRVSHEDAGPSGKEFTVTGGFE